MNKLSYKTRFVLTLLLGIVWIAVLIIGWTVESRLSFTRKLKYSLVLTAAYFSLFTYNYNMMKKENN